MADEFNLHGVAPGDYVDVVPTFDSLSLSRSATAERVRVDKVGRLNITVTRYGQPQAFGIVDGYEKRRDSGGLGARAFACRDDLGDHARWLERTVLVSEARAALSGNRIGNLTTDQLRALLLIVAPAEVQV